MNADTVSQLVTVLEKTTSGDQNELKQAQQFLEQAAQTNLPQLIRFVYPISGLLLHKLSAGLSLKFSTMVVTALFADSRQEFN